MSDNEKALTRIELAMASIRERIEKAPGTKLPSIRRLAEQQGVSKSTVVEAYDRLVAEGEVDVKPGSGFFGSVRLRPLELGNEVGLQPDRLIDPLWIMRQSLAVSASASKPGCGWLPEEWLPSDLVRRILRSVAREPKTNVISYGPPQGFAPLREQLARRLNARDIAAEPKSILLTDSATHAIDLVCRFLLNPGDTVLVDDPCYFNFRSMILAHRANVVGIPLTPNGPDLDQFAAACTEHRPRIYLSTAVLHNPTSTNINLNTAYRLLKLAETHDLIIIEDCVYADLEEHSSPGLAALDGFERVILVGSFSKTLTGALRSGFIAARDNWIGALTDLALATSFGVSDMGAQITHRLLMDGSYRHHLDALRPRLARHMTATIHHLENLGLTLWARPQAGMFVWAQLPDGLDSSDIARRALEHNMVLAPGNVFSVSQTAGSYLRFNVAQCGDRKIYDLLASLMRS